MGVNFTQDCIIGVDFDIDQATVVDEEAVYDKQPRYNRLTGEIEIYENVLIKSKKVHYSLFGVKSSDFCCLVDEIAGKFDLHYCFYDNYTSAVIGLKPIPEQESYGKVDLIKGFVPLSRLYELISKVEEKLGDGAGEIGIIFTTNVG